MKRKFVPTQNKTGRANCNEHSTAILYRGTFLCTIYFVHLKKMCMSSARLHTKFLRIIFPHVMLMLLKYPGIKRFKHFSFWIFRSLSSFFDRIPIRCKVYFDIALLYFNCCTSFGFYSRFSLRPVPLRRRFILFKSAFRFVHLCCQSCNYNQITSFAMWIAEWSNFVCSSPFKWSRCWSLSFSLWSLCSVQPKIWNDDYFIIIFTVCCFLFYFALRLEELVRVRKKTMPLKMVRSMREKRRGERVFSMS